MQSTAMNTLKTILALTGLLFIGFVAGFIVHRQMMLKEVKKVAEMQYAFGLTRNMAELIAAEDAQLEHIQPIITKYAQQIARNNREFREERKALLEAMEKELEPLLEKEQLEKLKRFNRRFRRPDDSLRRGMPPPNRMRRFKPEGRSLQTVRDSLQIQ